MDPVTALALATKAICEMVTEIVKGQTPEQKKQIWDWYIADQERWRKWFHVSD